MKAAFRVSSELCKAVSSDYKIVLVPPQVRHVVRHVQFQNGEYLPVIQSSIESEGQSNLPLESLQIEIASMRGRVEEPHFVSEPPPLHARDNSVEEQNQAPLRKCAEEEPPPRSVLPEIHYSLASFAIPHMQRPLPHHF